MKNEILNKCVLYFGFMLLIFIVPTVIYAKSVGSDYRYTNRNNIQITNSEYEKLLKHFTPEMIDHLSKDDFLRYTENDFPLVWEVREYSKYIHYIDSNGKLIYIKETQVTKEEYEDIKTVEREITDLEFISLQKNTKKIANIKRKNIKALTVGADLTLSLHIVSYTSKKYELNLRQSWSGVPLVKAFDILAINTCYLQGKLTIYDMKGEQSFVNKSNQSVYWTYGYKGANSKIVGGYAYGLSQNIGNDAKSYLANQMRLFFQISGSIDNLNVRGTYQHAKVANDLAHSQRFTISGQGLGGVLLYNNTDKAKFATGFPGIQKVYGNLNCLF